MAKHKHAALIHAYADGADIQVKSPIDGKWNDIDNPSFYDDTEYRIKPEPKKFRVALFNSGTTFLVNNEETAGIWLDDKNFVKWLTEWMEYEE